MAEIKAKKRSEIGKGLSDLRKAGMLPAVLYGEGVPSTPLSVAKRDFSKAFRESGETSVLSLKVEGDKSYNVLIYDVATHPLTSQPIHADFYVVRMDKPIEAKVPLVFLGRAPAVENDGGILVKVHHELEVKALPGDMPHEISVSIDALANFDAKIFAKDLVLPAGVTALVHADEVIALVEPPRAEEELAVEVKPEGATPVEVKTERELKAEAKAEAEKDAADEK